MKLVAPERENIKKLTILHSNDMHGDFLPTEKDGKMTGGLPLLSGYVNKVRAEKENVIYAIAGDMFRGSIIDSEYQGLSTIELMNLMCPDVATIGNHEVDYGLAHLLFIEKCAKFPIINANFFITMNNSRIFTPYINLEGDGMRILVIGILTQEVLSATKQERLVGTFVDVEKAAKSVAIICDNYRTVNTDMTILLTHIGLEQDIRLAELLDENLGVDLIIGGHSHTFMDKPEVVNGIPIVQAGTGTGIIGRFDIDYDKDRHEILDYKWECIPINEDTAPIDKAMEELLDSYRSETDKKYKRVITRWARELTHPSREQETEMGNLYCDAIQWESSFDIMMMGSGSIRKKAMGPVVEYQDMVENTPYDDCMWLIEVTGAQFRRMITHIFRDEAWLGETEFYQFSHGVRFVWKKSTHELLEFKFNGEDIKDSQRIKIGLQNYHYSNFEEFLGVPLEEVSRNYKPRVIAVTINNIVEEYFATHNNLDAHVEGRIVILD